MALYNENVERNRQLLDEISNDSDMLNYHGNSGGIIKLKTEAKDAI